MPPVYCERCDRRCRTVFDCVRKCGATLCSNRCADEHEASCRHDPGAETGVWRWIMIGGTILAAAIFVLLACTVNPDLADTLFGVSRRR